MNKRTLIATVIGAVIAFIWGFVSWSFLSWHMPKAFKDSAAVSQVILENSDDHGIYMAPSYTESGKPDVKSAKQGLFIYATVKPARMEASNMLKPMAMNFAVNLFLALILAVIMARRSHYRSKVFVGLGFGLFAGITAALPHTIWLELPAMETTARLCDPIISWTLAALVMALIVKKPKRRIFAN